jgi:23S rRNA (uridine2552-2'-O)-methyltransferase
VSKGPKRPNGKQPGGRRTGDKGAGLTGRGLTTRVLTAKRRKTSSTRWLHRQLNDPYVAEARRQGYRSRAAFKLIELDDGFRLLKPGATVVDLGATPGGWTQVAVSRVRAGEIGGGAVVAVDMVEMDPVPGADMVVIDFRDDDAPTIIEDKLRGPVDVVLSDMAPPSSGHTGTDHLRIMALAEMALTFAAEVLRPGGAFVCKVLQGGTEPALLKRMKQMFATVKHAKPPSSRAESAELYVVAKGFRRI